MSMQIGKSTSFVAVAVVATRPLEPRQPFKELRQSMRSGDLDAAASAYATLAAEAPNVLALKPEGPFAQIGTALAASDMAAARCAFETMVRSHLPRVNRQTGSVPPQNDDPAPAAPSA